jgi:hypothetical protein
MPISQKHWKVVYEMFKNQTMIKSFYLSLFDKMKNKDNCVRDILNIIPKNLLNNLDNLSDSDQEYIQKIVNEFLISLFDKFVNKGLMKINRIHEFTDDEIDSMFANNFADYDSFVVMGCPESTDIDVVAFVRENDHDNGQTKLLSKMSTHRLYSELKDLGYDIINKEIDICLVYVDPVSQLIVAASKADVETQNIINDTWHYHKQIMNEKQNLPKALVLHLMRYVDFTKEQLFNKLRTFAKYVLDYAEDICLDYRSFRPSKVEAYTQGGQTMMLFLQKSDWIVHDPSKLAPVLDIGIWQTRFKAIIMKLLQICLIFSTGKTIYVKSELALSIRDSFDSLSLSPDKIKEYEEGALYYLFRGNRGDVKVP